MSNIAEKAKRGLPVDDALIIDCHCHMGYWHNFHVPYNSAEGILESMDALGINIACVAAHSSIGPDYRAGNDLVIGAVLRYPDRFAGYATVNPNYAGDMKNELERCFAEPGMRGIKLHPGMHGRQVDSKSYCVAYETADKRNCPILIHVWGRGDVAAVDKLAGQYPGTGFIMGHAGGEIKAMEDATDVVNRHENVYVDLAVSMANEGNVEWFVKEMGSQKVLFGSDMPFLDPRPTFGRVAFAGISVEDKRNVFGLNMKRLLKV